MNTVTPMPKVTGLNSEPTSSLGAVESSRSQDAPSARGKCIHELFQEQVERTPEGIALVHEGQEVSYAELNRRAENLARRLSLAGVRAESLCGLLSERSVEMVVGILAILKAGGAYVPMDVGYPRERLALMIEDANLKLLLTQRKWLEHLAEHDAEVICFEDIEVDPREEVRRAESVAAATANAAYVIYTSGSTGTPKGVLVEHRALVNHSTALIEYYGLQPGERVLQFASLSFDVAAEELFPSLLSGATVVLFPPSLAASLDAFVAFLEKEKLTVINLPTSYWHEWVQAMSKSQSALPSMLRLVVIGSEKALPEKFLMWRKLVGDRLRLCNAYGPTETTITATIYETRKDEPDSKLPRGEHDSKSQSVPIGRPISNCHVYLLDTEQRPVAVGAVGELFISGEGLARGYLHHPGTTAEKFIPEPFGKTPGARMYRTGDLARIALDGNLEFHGRVDHQVKVRGFRIELGEIETALNHHPAISEAVVIACEDQQGAQRLVAYVTGDGKRELSARELRAFLKQRLPAFMVPSTFMMLEALPLLPNGKVNRCGLPKPDQSRPTLDEDFVAPRTSIEEAMANLWKEVLGLAQVGIHDDFFELGGDSLRSMQLISRVRETFQAELPPHIIFNMPTVATLVEGVAEACARQPEFDCPPLLPAPRDRPLPLSFPQQAVWLLTQMSSESLAYSTQLTLRFQGELDVPILRQALTEIVRRHEIFRTTFELVAGMPAQMIQQPWTVELPVIDLQPVHLSEREAAAERVIYEECRRAMDPKYLPLVRWSLIRLGSLDHILVQVEHHFVHDGWSLSLLLRELKQLYEAFLAGRPSPLPDLPVQFADFTVWQRQWLQGSVLENLLTYWKKRLAASPPLLKLPTDRARPKVLTYKGAVHAEVLPTDLCAALQGFCRREGVTKFMTMLAAFYALLSRYSGEADIVVGTSVANRRLKETESLIGMIVNTIILRMDLSGNPSFRQLLKRVRETTLEAFDHQDMPFEKLVEELKPPRDPSYNPLFQVMFNFHDSQVPEMNLQGATGKLQYQHNSTSKFDINIIVIPRLTYASARSAERSDEGMIMEWEYSTDLFDPSTIGRMVKHYLSLLRSALDTPDEPFADLLMLTDDEQVQLLRGWERKPAKSRQAHASQNSVPAKEFVATAEQDEQERLEVLKMLEELSDDEIESELAKRT